MLTRFLKRAVSRLSCRFTPWTEGTQTEGYEKTGFAWAPAFAGGRRALGQRQPACETGQDLKSGAKPVISGKIWPPSCWLFLQIHHLWNSCTSHAVNIQSPHGSYRFYRRGAGVQKWKRRAEGFSHRGSLWWRQEFVCFPQAMLAFSSSLATAMGED